MARKSKRIKRLQSDALEGQFAGPLSPAYLRTPKTNAGDIIEHETPTVRESSGPMCWCLHRALGLKAGMFASELKEDSPSFQTIMDQVNRETLASAVCEDINDFWQAASGLKEAVVLKTASPTLTGDGGKLKRHAERVLGFFRRSKQLKEEVNVWLDEYRQLVSQGRDKDESAEERFSRLQEFWGQFHEPSAHKELSPVRQLYESPRPGSTSQKTRPAGNEDPMFAEVDIGRQVSGMSALGAVDSERRQGSDRPLCERQWASQGFFPPTSAGTRPASSSSSATAVAAAAANTATSKKMLMTTKERFFKPSADLFADESMPMAWKARQSRSRCQFGRWDWCEGATAAEQSLLTTPFEAKCLSTVSTEGWFKKADHSMTAPPMPPPIMPGDRRDPSLFKKMMDPKYMGLTSFMTPKHMQPGAATRGSSGNAGGGGAGNKSRSLPDLNAPRHFGGRVTPVQRPTNKRRAEMPTPDMSPVKWADLNSPGISQPGSPAGSVARQGRRGSRLLDESSLPIIRSPAGLTMTPGSPSGMAGRRDVDTFSVHSHPCSVSMLSMGDLAGYFNGAGDSSVLPPPVANHVAEPWRASCEASSIHAFASPTGKYLQVCSEHGLIPALIPFVTGHSTKLHAAGKDLVDSDLVAVTKMVRGVRIEEVNLNGCVLLSDNVLNGFVKALMGMPASEYLRDLNLRRCVGAGLGTVNSVVTLLADQVKGAKNLRSLDIGGVKIGIVSQLPLCRAVNQHHTLEYVRLAETGLGQGADAKQCLKELLSSRSVESLNLDWNCFTSDAFSKLGECLINADTLRALSLSNCSALADSAPSGKSAKQVCPPVVFFIEHLSKCRTLTKLDISINRIDFRAALCIEDALEANRSVQELDVSFNPLGPYGLRSIIRCMGEKTNHLRYVNTAGCHQGLVVSVNDLVFSRCNPSGRYRLNLARPEDRAVLRMLYKSCERFGISPEAGFIDLQHSEKGYAHATKDPETSSWALSMHSGIMKAAFSVEQMKGGSVFKEVDDYDFASFFRHAAERTSVSPGVDKGFAVPGLWRLCGTKQEKDAMLEALSRDILLTYPCVRQLCSSREVTSEVLSRVIHNLDGGTSSQSLAFLLLRSPADLVQVLRRTEICRGFNPQNPTGHYRLNLAQAGDRAVAERLLLLDRWEAGVARRKELVDVSARGNRSFLRNELFQAQPLPVSPQEWHLPESEVFEFDYASSQRPSQMGDLPILDEQTLDTIVSVIQESICSANERVDALKGHSEREGVASLLRGASLERHDLRLAEAARLRDVLPVHPARAIPLPVRLRLQ
eukprot:TRINITY_DN47210_c0_g1_i1.p1 TRINITY_DN47210_c0_g1~~TRINITY_DN47210_c0_g1_i1.p1  ORF type:complete len:1295 (+),score=272.31 TRINITY_DN47210_c0_g1_i1:211-4095(+)